MLHRNKLVLLLAILLLASCSDPLFLRREPVGKVNDKFLAYYGNDVNKAKKKHNKMTLSNEYSNLVPEEQTAYGRIKRKEAEFLAYNRGGKPYTVVENAGGEPQYLAQNSDAFKKPDTTFDDIVVPDGDFEFYYVGSKDFNEVNNRELQQSYDYVYVINKEIAKQTELIKLREREEAKKYVKEEEGFLDRTRKGLQSLTDRIKGLLK